MHTLIGARAGALAASALFGAAWLFGPPSLHAQEPVPDASPVVVVLDALTLAGVPGAEVLLPGVGTFHADGEGRVVLPPGVGAEVRLVVTSLGYVSSDARHRLAPGTAVTVSLDPDPALLDRIEVVADRLDYRRARTFGPVRVMDSRQLANVGLGGLETHVRAMVGGLGPCASASGGCGGDPAFVLLDDWLFPFRLDELDRFASADLYAIEVYPRLSVVRVYTRDFIARAAENPRLVRIHGTFATSAMVTPFREPTFAGVLRADLPGF